MGLFNEIEQLNSNFQIARKEIEGKHIIYMYMWMFFRVSFVYNLIKEFEWKSHVTVIRDEENISIFW